MRTLRAITVQQPWAWAIVRGGKDVENRRNRTGLHAAVAQFNRPGPIAIHAGLRYAGTDAWNRMRRLSTVDPGFGPGGPGADPAWMFGHVLAIATLAGIHTSEQCLASGRLCSPWAEDNAAHLQITNVRPLYRPVELRGSQGMWEIKNPSVLSEIRRQAA
ncbi:MAG TPA: hypothetical protein VMF51_18140 [Nocardioides sp.]|uniref:hypothetical protein n=1 Tax=Nocardioides sp. TaxID=35761 RepID=UPI002BC0078D|nr:hypothetical protein [Nocardioides sp.]HTW17056.1 hypothetical protein [Nocardioides sp.]